MHQSYSSLEFCTNDNLKQSSTSIRGILIASVTESAANTRFCQKLPVGNTHSRALHEWREERQMRQNHIPPKMSLCDSCTQVRLIHSSV